MKDLIEKIEANIREGQLAQARSQLKAIRRHEIPRSLQKEMASLARRCQLFQMALKILHPTVRLPSHLEPPTSAEKAEYAASLLRANSVSEARQLLLSCSAKEAPEVNLFLGFCEVMEWRYKESIIPLRKFIEEDRISPYQKLVAKLNVAAAYTAIEEFHEANVYLADLESETADPKLSLLHSSVLELKLQNQIQMRQWSLAEETYEIAKNATPGNLASQHRFLSKWHLVLQMEKNPSHKKIEELVALVQSARTVQDFETVRDGYYYLAKYTGDESYLLPLYFGTPFAPFRNKILKLGWSPPAAAIFPFVGTKDVSESQEYQIFDILNMPGLKEQSSLHRLIMSLNMDYFRPPGLGLLFQRVFPAQFYNPDHSPNRIHQLIKRLRQWIDTNQISWNLIEIKSRYQLELTVASRLKVPENLLTYLQSPQDPVIGKLLSHFGANEFDIREVTKILDLSVSSARRALSEAIEQGLIIKTGQGRYTRYRKVSSEK